MTYLSASKLRFAQIREVRGPALMIPHDRPEDVLFIGSGEDPFACLLDGQWKGEGFRAQRAENWQGLVIENVDLRVDFTSLSSSSAGKRLLMAVRKGSSLGLFIHAKEGAFGQTITCDVRNDLPAGSDDTRLAFTRWKLFIREADQDVEIFSLDLDAQAAG